MLHPMVSLFKHQLIHHSSYIYTGVITETKQHTRDLLDSIKTLDPEERTKQLTKLSDLFQDVLRHGNDKLALAIQTYDTVSHSE
jgi:Inhibitor of growth proteins N-terminal histone-binding